jgi:hypothetical protein
MTIPDFFVSLEVMEYRIDKRMRLFMTAVCALFALLGLACLIQAFLPPADKQDTALVVMGAFLTLLGLFLFLQVIKSRLIINNKGVYLQEAFRTRSLLLDEIAGYGYFSKNRRLVIIPKSPKQKKIIISNFMEGRRELEIWLARFPNLDAVKYEQEADQIFSNEQLGASESERLVRLKKARTVANAGNTVGIASLVWAWMSPQPYDWAIITAFILPWVALYISWHFKGLIRFGAQKASPYPSMGGLVFLPVVGLWLRVLIDYPMYEPAGVWVPVLATTALLAMVCLYISNKLFGGMKKNPVAWLILLVVTFTYSYGLVIFTNCYYDGSAPKELRVTVNGKRINKGRTTTYYLSLDAWGRYTEEQEVSVKKALFEKINEGEQVHIYLFGGRWHMPWYHIMQ